MRALTWTILIGALAAGCTVGEKSADWPSQDGYPPWMYDAPFYHEPSEDLAVLETLNGTPIYHSHSEYFFIRHPAGCQAASEPRLGVWYSTNQGQVWEKAGFFGLEQSHFLLRAESEGQCWIRFVGSVEATSDPPAGMPHRIYIVDRQRPRVLLRVTPSPWQDSQRKLPRKFSTGQNVVLRWLIRDRRLDKNSPKLQVCFARYPQNAPWLTVPEKIEPSGTMTIEIPEKATIDGQVRFRVSARDLAGNIGTAASDVLHVISSKAPMPAARIKASESADAIRQTQGTRAGRPGWPAEGTLLRGGTTCVLDRLPASAGSYSPLNLEFSADDSQSWLTVAKGLKAGAKNEWTVPTVTSKNCRLQIVGFNKDGQKYMLIMGPRFTVTTVAPAETM